MTPDENLDPGAEAYRAALDHHAVRDVQPTYRQLLRRLKADDPDAYDEAVERYRTDVSAPDDPGSDPLLRWIEYGTWLAGRLAAGRLVSIDGEGRARTAVGPPPLGPLLLFLPEEKGAAAIPIAEPVEPSAAQQATRQLLCG